MTELTSQTSGMVVKVSPPDKISILTDQYFAEGRGEEAFCVVDPRTALSGNNMLDRLMRGMNRCFVSGQRLHGKCPESRRHPRSLALLWNFAPWSPLATRATGGWQSPAERLHQHRSHNGWLQNLLISASSGGYRHPRKT